MVQSSFTQAPVRRLEEGGISPAVTCLGLSIPVQYEQVTYRHDQVSIIAWGWFCREGKWDAPLDSDALKHTPHRLGVRFSLF